MRRDPFAADPRPAPTSALEYFTDREGYIEAFTRHCDTPADQGPSVLVFYGVGGIGKTTLIRKLCELTRSDPLLPHARFNLESVGGPALAYRDVLLRLRSDLENDSGIKFPRFDLALAVLLAREGGERPPLVQISPGLDSAFRAALEFAPSLIKAGIKLASQGLQSAVQRSDTLEHWVRQVGGTEAILNLSERFGQDDGIVTEELIRRFAQDLADGLPARPGLAVRGVLFLDTYESLWAGREDSLGAQARQRDAWVRLLAEYSLGAGVLLVIAGRDRLGWGDGDPEWESCLDQHLLGGVSARDAQAFLSRRGIGGAPPAAPDPLQAAILHCAGGADGPDGPGGCHLLALALSADIVGNTRRGGGEPDPALFGGVPPAKIADELAARFLKSLHSRNLELWVEALSLTPRFDEGAALALDAARQSQAGRAGWEQLRRYSFVTAQPDGFYRMHRTMREVLRARSPENVAQTLHAWFERHWRERGEEGLAFYHRWVLNPAGELTAWAAGHAAAVEARKTGEARALLARWAEVALDEDDRVGLEAFTWARTHAVLGEAWRTTPLAPRLARLEGAARHFRSALSVWTEAEQGEEWAGAQYGLGLVHQVLPAADRAETLRTAGQCFQSSLRVRTREAWPQKWANMQNNLGCNLLLMPAADPAERGENLRGAAAHFRAVLEIQTEDAHPRDWAMTQHNLGIAYYDLPDGDRAENLQQSIAHFQAALRVHTEEDLPDSWAETQNSLGYSLLGRPEADALRQALDCFTAAQRVWTEADNPDRWAQARQNQGRAYAALPEGDRASLSQQAISCFRDALRVHTEERFPDHFAAAQKGLGLALRSLAAETGDAREPDEARLCLLAAARGYRAVGLSAEADEAERLAGAGS